MGKVHKNTDTLRKEANLKLKKKNCVIVDLQEQFKNKEIAIDNLMGIKIQMSQEIEVWLIVAWQFV